MRLVGVLPGRAAAAAGHLLEEAAATTEITMMPRMSWETGGHSVQSSFRSPQVWGASTCLLLPDGLTSCFTLVVHRRVEEQQTSKEATDNFQVLRQQAS